jgi:hypothetical protein
MFIWRGEEVRSRHGELGSGAWRGCVMNRWSRGVERNNFVRVGSRVGAVAGRDWEESRSQIRLKHYMRVRVFGYRGSQPEIPTKISGFMIRSPK